jgi:hypothetical protein
MKRRALKAGAGLAMTLLLFFYRGGPMNAEVITTIVIAVCTMASSWAVWVSVSVFKQSTEIALIKKEIELMTEVKDVLNEIKNHLITPLRDR